MTKKTFTPEEVAELLATERLRTKTVDALLLSIQRSRMSGDDMSITDALGNLMNEVAGIKPQPKEPEVLQEEKNPEE